MIMGIQTIFASMDREDRIDRIRLNRKQKKVLKNIIECKTEIRGFHSDTCECCGHTQIHYNSCRDPNCPQCGAFDRELWIRRQERHVLNVKYFHVVFTIPSELNPFVLADPAFMYQALFAASARTMKELAGDEKYLGARIGFTSVLHTWGQNLSLHPHIHMIVPGGGMDTLDRWKPSRKKFFIPVRVLSRAFRGKFLDHVKKHFDRSRLKDTTSFHAVLNTCYGKDWVVYIKKPMNDAGHVIRYLGRYTHRIAISNARIQGYEDHRVTFTYRDYSDHDRIKTMTLEDTEFLRRFMMHILPAHFMKIRHYGFLGNRNREERMKVIRAATKTQESGPCRIDLEEILSHILKRDVSICIRCGQKRHHKLE